MAIHLIVIAMGGLFGSFTKQTSRPENKDDNYQHKNEKLCYSSQELETETEQQTNQ